jgi:hypothetical protein
MPDAKQPSTDVIVAKILLSVSGSSSDAYTESLLGGAILALTIQKQQFEAQLEAINENKNQPTMDQQRVGEMPKGPSPVQSSNTETAQAVE